MPDLMVYLFTDQFITHHAANWPSFARFGGQVGRRPGVAQNAKPAYRQAGAKRETDDSRFTTHASRVIACYDYSYSALTKHLRQNHFLNREVQSEYDFLCLVYCRIQ